jgi:hypothetical protein
MEERAKSKTKQRTEFQVLTTPDESLCSVSPSSLEWLLLLPLFIFIRQHLGLEVKERKAT